MVDTAQFKQLHVLTLQVTLQPWIGDRAHRLQISLIININTHLLYKSEGKHGKTPYNSGRAAAPCVHSLFSSKLCIITSSVVATI